MVLGGTVTMDLSTRGVLIRAPPSAMAHAGELHRVHGRACLRAAGAGQ